MTSFYLFRQSDPAAMPIAQPDDVDPWRLEWHEGTRRFFVSFLDRTADDADDEDGLDSFLAFVAYLGCPVKITDNGSTACPMIEILDVVVPRVPR